MSAIPPYALRNADEIYNAGSQDTLDRLGAKAVQVEEEGDVVALRIPIGHWRQVQSEIQAGRDMRKAVFRGAL